MVDVVPGSESLADTLRRYRQRAGLTQQELADRAGLSVAGLRDVEQGRVVAPRPQTLRRLGTALGLSPAEFAALTQQTRPARPTSEVWIGVLGPLQVRVDGNDVDPGSPAQRLLLGLLALAPNTPVAREVLLERVEGARSPGATPDSLATRISRLRRRLRPRSGRDAVTLTATSGGYQLNLTEEQSDLLTFRSLVRRARHHRLAADLARACDLYAQALALWRADPLGGLTALATDPLVVGLHAEWRATVLEYAAIATELGRHDEVVPPLRRLCEQDPLHEPAHARLMVALAGSGQQAAALQIFDALRRRLATEMGVEPSAELAEAHRRVLRQQVAVSEAVPLRVYRQLPPDLPEFTGREAQLRWFEERLPAPGTAPATVWVVQGAAGIGKTRFAVHLAHRLAGRGYFAGPQLFVDLRGRADTPPADPGAVLAWFLRSLGVPESAIPPDQAARAALYQERLRGRHALVVLDNAASAAQVTPLLPTVPATLALVTSRRALALPDATTLTLGVFSEEEALRLLTRLVGPARTAREPRAAEQIVRQCGHLPLAVALAARRLQSRPQWTLADLASRLAHPRYRLGELTVGGRDLRTRLGYSYRAVSATSQRIFRLLGRHPAMDMTEDTVCALAGVDRAAARLALNQLVEEHLVMVARGRRYVLPRLIRDYARELARPGGSD